MFQVILRYSLAASGCVTIMVLSAMLMGGSIPSRVIVTVSNTDRIQIIPEGYRSSHFLSFIDLDRLLSVRHFPPIPSIRNMSLVTRDESRLTFIYSSYHENDQYHEGLLLYNIQTGAVTELLTHEGEERRIAPIYERGIYWSPDRTRFVYGDPETEQLYVMDITSGNTTPIGDLPGRNASLLQEFRWSSTGDQVSYQDGAVLHLVNADGTNPRAFEQPAVNFFYTWSPDDRYIMLNSGATLPNPPEVHIFDTQTGEPHPHAGQINSSFVILNWYSFAQDCYDPVEANWLMYRQQDPNSSNIPGSGGPTMLMNLHNGEEVNLSEKLEPEEQVNFVTWWRDCKTLLINTGAGGIYAAEPENQKIYAADLDGENLRYLFDGGLIGSFGARENAVYFQKVVRYEQDKPVFEIYRKDMEADTPPEFIGTHTLTEMFLQWADVDKKAALVLDSSSSLRRSELLYVDLAAGEHFPISPKGDRVLHFQVVDW